MGMEEHMCSGKVRNKQGIISKECGAGEEWRRSVGPNV
jgi:hypothetical protein